MLLKLGKALLYLATVKSCKKKQKLRDRLKRTYFLITVLLNNIHFCFLALTVLSKLYNKVASF